MRSINVRRNLYSILQLSRRGLRVFLFNVHYLSRVYSLALEILRYKYTHIKKSSQKRANSVKLIPQTIYATYLAEDLSGFHAVRLKTRAIWRQCHQRDDLTYDSFRARRYKYVTRVTRTTGRSSNGATNYLVPIPRKYLRL